MLKVLKQCSISNLFSSLAYKRIKIKTVKKCYILVKFIAAWPYGLGGLSLSARTALGICIAVYAPDTHIGGPALVVKLAERISATIGQENGQENNRRNIEQF